MVMELIYGINPLKEALISGGEGVTRIVVARGRSESAISEIRTLATQQGIPVEVRERAFLDNLAGHASHQGVLGVCRAYRYQDLDAVIANRHPACPYETGRVIIPGSTLEWKQGRPYAIRRS